MQKCTILCGLLLCAVAAIPAQEPQRRGGPGGFGGPVELGPDDKQAYADPPDGIVARREETGGAARKQSGMRAEKNLPQT